jgi:hypothetical protein
MQVYLQGEYMDEKANIELQFSSKYGYFGSKEHFFHYFWGYALPGMHLLISTTKSDKVDCSLVLEDCGPVMNKVALQLFGLITSDIKFQKHDDFSSVCTQVPRWDIMINFDSVLFEDEHSFRGSTMEYRENEYLKIVLNEQGFLQRFQNEMRELRSWVLERVVEPGAGEVGQMKPRPAKGATDNLPVQLKGSLPIRMLKRMIQKFLNLNGPKPIRIAQRVLIKMLEKFRDFKYGSSSNAALIASGTKKKRKAHRKPQILLLCRSPEPEYYSEKGGAEAKKYGASRRTLVEIDKSFEYFKSKGHNIRLYEPGADTLIEQIKTFYASDVVIGIKGAELSNTFWMKPGAKMFIVTPSVMRSTPVYERFGRFLGIKSINIFAKDGRTPSLYRLRREINDQL